MSEPNTFPADYRPLPVEALKDISERYDRDIVVVLSWSKSNKVLNSSSYGREAAHKDQAGAIADLCTQALGYAEGSDVKVYEDFRTPTEAAQSRERAEAAERQLAEADKMIARLLTVTPVETIMALIRGAGAFVEESRAYLTRAGAAPGTPAEPQAVSLAAYMPQM